MQHTYQTKYLQINMARQDKTLS